MTIRADDPVGPPAVTDRLAVNDSRTLAVNDSRTPAHCAHGAIARTAIARAAPRVLIVTASMGAGHVEVANELRRRLAERGASVEVVDMLEAAGPAGARLRRTYRLLLDRAPSFYDRVMRCWARFPRALELLTAAGDAPFRRALARALQRCRPDVVVSTYNLAGQVLGRLRARGRVSCPLVTVVTDPGAHPYWVSRDVDLHLAPTAGCAAALSRYGAVRVAQVSPILRPEFDDPPPRDLARAHLGLPRDARIVLLTAGSWAAGGIDATLDVIAGMPDVLPVVLCGRDGALLQRTQSLPQVRGVPWTPEVVSQLAAADVVVDNAGGLTCWEALACGVPVVLYEPLPGHGRLNAAALDGAGLARQVRTSAELADSIRDACERAAAVRTRRAFPGKDASEQIMQLAGVPANGRCLG